MCQACQDQAKYYVREPGLRNLYHEALYKFQLLIHWYKETMVFVPPQSSRRANHVMSGFCLRTLPKPDEGKVVPERSAYVCFYG